MAFSGLIGAGAAQSLQQLLAKQELARQQALAEQQQQFGNQLALRRQNFAETEAERGDEQFQQTRRDRSNVQGLEEMHRQREILDQEGAQREFSGRLERIAQDPNIPEEVRALISLDPKNLQRVGVEDVKSPATKAREKAEAEAAELDMFGKKAEISASTQARYREPREPKPKTEGMTPQQMSAAKAFMDDYARDSKTYLQVRDGYQRVATAAQKPDAAGDLSLIFGYMKMLDPNSVVRETEFANAQNAAGVPDQVRNLYNRAMSGERLNPNQRAQFVGQARQLMEVAHSNQRKVRDTYGNRSQKFGIDPATVLDQEDDLSQMGGAPSASGGPTVGEVRVINGRRAKWDGRGWLPEQ